MPALKNFSLLKDLSLGWIELQANAPKLRFIKYSGRVAIFDLDHICCLEEADLDFGLESSFGSNDGDFLYNLLLDLFSVTILTACSYMLQVIPYSEGTTGTESPLNDYKPLFEFNPSEFWTKNLVVHKCIRRTLKLVEVKGFKGTVNEFLVLQYLICLGRVMERMNLYISRETDDNGGNLELYRASAQMLLQLKKASKKRQISIY
ncbi:F-box protein At3g62230-like [Durio zibethinus]|uniref:F-box protein At3g62230-like n=1 Tax=Durio zibethinus TaxID=66656 RepID=A0A6P5ZMS4_DURZI|nr:F-box protein At3g62230-like [Durio zibethinus]